VVGAVVGGGASEVEVGLGRGASVLDDVGGIATGGGKGAVVFGAGGSGVNVGADLGAAASGSSERPGVPATFSKR